jgi:hypothetical protein
MNQTGKISNPNLALISIKNTSITSIESSIMALTRLMENLRIYKQTMLDSFILEAKSINIENKPAAPFQPHTLPGIISFPQIIKSNSDQIKSNKEKIIRQKRIFFRLIEKDSRLFFQSLKGLKYSDASYEEFLEILNGNINLNLQPNTLDDRPAARNAGIKLSIEQKLSK